MNPLIILAGPTASGKSETAVALAEHLDSEIISADSMQVYKYFDVGTAKPSPGIRRRVPHHLIDILEPDEEFTAFDFKTRSLKLIHDLDSRGKAPVMVGGTGLYLKTLLEDRDCAVAVSPEIRDRVRAEIREHGPETLYRELQQVDPDYAETISANDPARIERALSVYRESGKPLSSFHQEDTATDLPFETYLFLLERERSVLYQKINDRVEEMIENGLKAEVQSLLERGYAKILKPFQAIGYAQMVAHLEGQMDLDQAVHEIQRETRHYAKRQVTWFKKMQGTRPVPVQDGDSAQSLKEKILKFLPQGVALLLFVLGGWLLPGSVAASETDPFPAAIRLLQKGEWDAARSALEGLQRAQLKPEFRRRVEFLLARVLIQSKHYEEAVRILKPALKQYKIMEDYILFELARAETARGQYPPALDYLKRLMKLRPRSLLKPKAGLLLADVYGLTHQPEQALKTLQETRELIRKHFSQPDYLEQIPEILFRQIPIQETLRDFDGSYASYRALWTRFPEHEHAREAWQHMQRLVRKQGVPEQPLSIREEARRLLAKARFQRVIDEVESLRKQKQNLPSQYYFLLADAYKGLRKRPKANRVLTEFLNKFSDHARAAKARFLIARNLWNLGNPNGAAEGFQKAIKASRKRKLTAEAHYLLGAVYEDLRKEKKAFQEYNRLIKDFSQTEFAEKGAWRIGWAHYRAHRWQQAHDRFQKNGERFPNGELVEKNGFWLAKTLEKLNQPEAALKAFQDVYERFPFTYYGLQAGNRLDAETREALGRKTGASEILKTQFNGEAVPPKNPGRLLNERERHHFQRGIELMKMGLYTGAQLELLQLNGSIRKTYTGVLWLSTWYNRAHAYADSLQLLHLFRRYKTKHREKELPVAFWKNFYPPAYFVYVRAWSDRHQVDPWLVTSLMRQESMYDTWSLSPAGARGLMQLMPKTARRMVRKNGNRDAFEPEVLFDPEINIQLGIQFLSGLVQKYKGNRTHILVAYNAGPKVLRAWLRRFHAIGDPDEFIESIPYPETRNYVKRVSRNHEIYKRLYLNEEDSAGRNKTF